jgi:hypothetical protein
MTHAGPEGTTSGNNSRCRQGDDQGPPHPSARLPRVCLDRHTMGGPCTIPLMLLSLEIPYVSYALVHFKCVFIRTQPTQALNDTGGGYHLGALNIRSDHSSSFPSSILHFPLITLPSLRLCQPFDHHAKPHWTSIVRKGHIASGFQPLVFYR